MTGKQYYEKIPIPSDLSLRVEDAIRFGLRTARRPVPIWKRAACLVLGGWIGLVGLLNCSPAFAETAGQLPLVGPVCEIFTFRSWHQQDEIRYLDVQVPHIQITGGSQLENQVNLEINRLIQNEVDAASKRAEEYYQAYLDTGGDPESFMPISIEVGYEITHLDDQLASFVISKSETMASAYFQQYFYNIDLQTGQLLSLRDWLGPDYREIAAESIQTAIDGWDEEKKALLFDDIDIPSMITENTNFYINEEGQAVIVFEKYQLAAGAAGILSFPVG